MASNAELGRAIRNAAAEATDLLLVYYAGHGLLDDLGTLYLATSSTEASAPEYSGLDVTLLRRDIGNSRADARVFILDCCFSWRAIGVMSDQSRVIKEQLTIAGTYTMTSTTANAAAYSLEGHRYTAFTGAFLTALDNPEPLSLNEIYLKVAEELRGRGLPEPQAQATNTAGAMALSRGGESGPRADLPPEEERFRLDKAAIRAQWRRFAARGIAVTTVVSAALSALFAALNHDASWLWYCLLWPALLAVPVGVIRVIVALVSPKEGELIIDRSGITTHWRYSRTGNFLQSHVAWTDIVHVGILPPEPGTVNPRLREIYDANHVLVVHLRPEVPVSSTVNLLPKKLNQLGYHGMCAIGGFGASKEQILAALKRFGGTRVVHNKQEFLARDPRLGPNMI